ncbi:hypothetical protein V6N12_047367 [Hibiscus sabdariffa]|uniref:Reverse transcriptase zinc-binding domain-containing protein n=1 Tax=Hibiscus sabdariffa TaxID=183260 RepID=A0ABR2DAN1_9ROSI
MFLWKIASIKPPSIQYGPDLPAAHDWLLTNTERFRHHIATSDSCNWCQSCVESVDHVLRMCLTASALWISVIKPHCLHEFFTMPLVVWLGINISGSHCFANNVKNWGERFVVFIWMLWKNRCSKFFDDSYVQREDFRAHWEKLAYEYVQVSSKPPGVRNLLRGTVT